MNQTVLLILSLLVMVGGLVGIILPFVPSVPLIWLGGFAYALLTNFTQVGSRFLLVSSVLVLLTIFLDYAIALWGVKKFEASLWAVLGAVIGGLLGSLVGIFYAIIVGPILGALIAEMLRGKDTVFSFAAQRYTVIGFVGGTIVKFLAGLTIVGLFLYEVFGRGL